ncbi:MAG: hypothetical protein WA667_08910 [Candidatus Nitrosopolaris sp.]
MAALYTSWGLGPSPIMVISRPFSHNGACIDQVDWDPGWRPVHDRPGHYEVDEKICEEMGRKEKDVRHELMQHIIFES